MSHSTVSQFSLFVACHFSLWLFLLLASLFLSCCPLDRSVGNLKWSLADWFQYLDCLSLCCFRMFFSLALFGFFCWTRVPSLIACFCFPSLLPLCSNQFVFLSCASQFRASYHTTTLFTNLWLRLRGFPASCALKSLNLIIFHSCLHLLDFWISTSLFFAILRFVPVSLWSFSVVELYVSHPHASSLFFCLLFFFILCHWLSPSLMLLLSEDDLFALVTRPWMSTLSSPTYLWVLLCLVCLVTIALQNSHTHLLSVSLLLTLSVSASVVITSLSLASFSVPFRIPVLFVNSHSVFPPLFVSPFLAASSLFWLAWEGWRGPSARLAYFHCSDMDLFCSYLQLHCIHLSPTLFR